MVEFATIDGERPGVIAALLRASYAELVAADPRWNQEAANWDEYDREVFGHPGTVGACLFVSRVEGVLAGFGSWDPRQRPACGIVGHNCVLPPLRGRGIGRLQIEEILRRFRVLGIGSARVSTLDHPFFAPAQRMYASCGFRELRRIPWDRDPGYHVVEYERQVGER